MAPGSDYHDVHFNGGATDSSYANIDPGYNMEAGDVDNSPYITIVHEQQSEDDAVFTQPRSLRTLRDVLSLEEPQEMN